MCGICGIIHFDGTPVAAEGIKDMLRKMKHRGPDDEGLFLDRGMGLGHVRLSIIDLSSAGHQPMFSDDGRYVIVYNGEVYNYLELKEELSPGYVFRTRTDTEVILNAYRRWGEDCLRRFNGMFSFVIYDAEERTFFAARDRFGVKPFYYYHDVDSFVFSSEIPPILGLLPRDALPDEESIFDYLVYNRTDQTYRTFFRDIKKLQHGHSLTIRNRTPVVKQWYRLTDHLDSPFANPEEFRDALRSSIELRLRSDVPVGVCLSGGLDSSSLVSLLINDFRKADLNTFSAVYGKGVEGDESAFIEEFRPCLSHMFFTRPSAGSLFEDMHSFVTAHGEPVPTPAPYAQYKVMELAKGHAVVLLDGQGADEQLAGYHYFFGIYFKELLLRRRLLKLARETFGYIRNHNSFYGLKTFAYFLLPSVLKTKSRISEKGYIKDDFIGRYCGQDVIAGQLYNAKTLHESLVNHFEYKLEHLLKWEDRNSMFFSLESRVPFLDYRLVERTLSLPAAEVIRDGMTKHFLRQSMAGVLPERIRVRKDKVGFDTPADEWFRGGPFKEYIRDLLNSSSFRERGYIDVQKAGKLYERHITGKINIAREIWKWINLELWFQNFIDGRED